MVTLPLYLLAFLDRQSLILMICVWRDDDQAEWVGSRKQHVSGFQKIINIMSVKFKTRHLLTPTKLYNMFFVQIMNVYECNGKNIFMSCKMKSSIQRGASRVEWNFPSFNKWKYSFHCTNAKHSLLVLCVLCNVTFNSAMELYPCNGAK